MIEPQGANATKTVRLFVGDLPSDGLEHLMRQGHIAVDVETTGLKPTSDKLALIQLCDPDGNVILVHRPDQAPNLRTLLSGNDVEFVFHHARFDLAFLAAHLQLDKLPARIACTKIGARIMANAVDRASLKELLARFLGVELTKDHAVRVSAWDEALSQEQIEYAARDVIWLIPLWLKIRSGLETVGRLQRARCLFGGIPPIALSEAIGLDRLFDY